MQLSLLLFVYDYYNCPHPSCFFDLICPVSLEPCYTFERTVSVTVWGFNFWPYYMSLQTLKIILMLRSKYGYDLSPSPLPLLDLNLLHVCELYRIMLCS